MSSVPWDVNFVYKGGASGEGEEDNVSVVCMGEGIRLGGIFERLEQEGVSENRKEEGEGTCWMGVVGMLRLTNTRSVGEWWCSGTTAHLLVHQSQDDGGLNPPQDHHRTTC